MVACPDTSEISLLKSTHQTDRERFFTSILFLFCRADRTMTGHVLGHPSTRAKGLVPERNLSSVVVGVTRVLMHCAMIEGACRQPQVIKSRFLCLECKGCVERDKDKLLL